MEVGARTHVGKVRPTNEDGYLIRDGLLAVADGMGGHRAGEVASGTALAVLREYPFGRGQPAAELAAAVQAAHARVRELAHRDADLRGMGTTLTAALVAGGRLHVAHVGDSRLYLWRDGRLHQLTADHSVAAELARAGHIDEATARRHPHRHVLTRALGIDAELEVDLAEVPLEPGDGLLLCTDGLSSLADDGEMLGVLEKAATAQAAADALVELALARGGTDNVTVVVARLD
ncbi:MAG: Stp1/IreP family PP2C-type Ser/Thr phosphatase [Limnochordales bacterium]|nr:Stp1/IreP family PP2C-type Ser/Thr phosphatase [Limnochordales bacterium]